MNKRHYEHTLPNIRGSLSNTYDKSDKIIDDDVLARLLSFNNVIVTSHQAFFTKEALHNIAETTLRNIKDFEEGRPLVNEVTK